MFTINICNRIKIQQVIYELQNMNKEIKIILKPDFYMKKL